MWRNSIAFPLQTFLLWKNNQGTIINDNALCLQELFHVFSIELIKYGFAIILIYTMSTFPLTIFFVITSFALRTKNQYFILLAFIAAPDVYFLPIIAGLLGLIMTSAQGNADSKLLYAEVTRKIRRIELRITAIVYRIK